MDKQKILTVTVGEPRKFKFITNFDSFDVDCYRKAIEAVKGQEDIKINMTAKDIHGNIIPECFSLHSRRHSLDDFWKILRELKNKKRKG